MPLLPNASIKTKYDFTRSRFEWKRQFTVAPTANIVEEGSVLTRLPGPTGDEVVQLGQSGALATGERPVGISLQSRISAATFTDVRNYTVPAAPGPYEVQLPHTNLLTIAAATAEAYVFDNSASPPAALTVIAHTAPPAPAATQVDIDPLTGLMTFNAAEAEHNITITYRWNLTAVERDLILRQSHVNRGAEDQFGLMTVGYGNCLVYTSMYECDQAYAVGTQVTLGDNGLWTLGGATNFGFVVSVPTPGDPYLGVEYISPS